MWLDWGSNPGPLPFELDPLPTALRGPAVYVRVRVCVCACVRACVCMCVCVCVFVREREGCLYSHVSGGKFYV